ncbi:MAG: LamG-like jellyroll fold domain-containing protein [Bacteroidota bacterium]
MKLKFYLLTLSLLLLVFFVQAQDTITVQTFTWESTNRADVFQFPDDPEQGYEKILMSYNMRCHDVAVGNGAVGCREWDYSCNTFITDPSRQDSVQATHPSHLITDFAGTDYAYTTQPTYSYVQYQQQQTTLVLNGVEETALIGMGTQPLNLDYNLPMNKMQFLYTGSELAAAGLTAGPLKGLRLQIGQGGVMLDALRIRLRASSLTSLDRTQPVLDGFQENYFRNTMMNNGWQDFNFHNPFDWDGSSNIIVELSWSNESTANTIVQFRGDDTGFDAGLITQPLNDQYLPFAGSNIVDVPISTFGDISNEITVAFWNYGFPSSLPSNSTLMEGLDADNNRQVNIHLPWGNGQVYWDCGNDGGGYDRINRAANTSDFAGRWNHWAFTKNATTGQMRIYLNGALWHSGTGLTKAIDVQRFVLGASSNWGLSHLGQIDELQIWSKALDAATIQEWMHRRVNADHPNFFNLEAYYNFDGANSQLLGDASSHGRTAQLVGQASLRQHRGDGAFKNFTSTQRRPNVEFFKGDYEISIQQIAQLDSFPSPANRVIRYEVVNNDLVAIDTVYRWAAGPQPILNTLGDSVGVVMVNPEDSYTIQQLDYFNKFDSKFEILSLVTPYGNGLDLGPEGKTFTFDVTDYAPILKGERRMSIEMGGQWQEELDIKFLFIKGTPPRDVVDIQNVWPFARGGYAAIQADNVFEPRTVQLSPQGQMYKLRSAVTGHGQNGEFTPRTHYLNLNGGSQDFTYQVWKACSENPIFPQGGTWLFDRAGWCPGMATDVHEFDISDQVSPGGTVDIDYGVNGALLDQANYLVSTQLVTYGAPNFQNDVELLDIYRPTGKLEHERINPACNQPQILIRNNGTELLTELTIYYGLTGGQELSFDWSGQLDFLETELIELPIDNVDVWNSSMTNPRFNVRLDGPNGAMDQNPVNNNQQSAFEMPNIFDFADLQFYFRTNNRASENSYTISDHTGQVLISRDNLQNETIYTEELSFPPGCYSLDLQDSGGDGTYYWYWNAIGQQQGFSEILFRRLLNGSIPIPLANFEKEFGGSIHYDFIVPQAVSTEELQNPTLLSLYPNPVSESLHLELQGFQGDDFMVELYDLRGQLLFREAIGATVGKVLHWETDLSNYPAGTYMVKLQNGNKVWVKEVVKS